MSRRRLIIVTLASMLVTCASSKEALQSGQVVDQAPPETTGAADSYAPTASWSEVIAEGASAEGWLKSFNDPELARIVDEALRNNRQIATASANLDAAARLAMQADAALAAAVAVGGVGHASERNEVVTRGTGTAFNVQWEVDVWGRLASAAAADGENFRASTAELEGARQSLVAQTVKAWFLAIETNLQLALSQEAIAIYEQSLEIVETRVESGEASPQDLLLARADLAAARERQLKAIGALTQAVRSIRIILGRYPSAELALPRDFIPVPPPIPIGIPADRLERRPDLVAAERRVAAAFQRNESTRAAKLPRLSLTTAGGRASRELTQLIDGDSEFFSAGANFIAPLIFGGELESQTNIETARQEAVLANYGATVLNVFSEVENTLNDEALLGAREASFAAAADDNAQAVVAARIQYDLGATDFLGVLQMQARELNSRISLIRIRNARLAQRVDLHLALGGDFQAAESGAVQ